MDSVLKKTGCTPYHICYRTDAMDQEIERLLEKHFVPVADKAPAAAFGGKNVAFFYKAAVGILELVEG